MGAALTLLSNKLCPSGTGESNTDVEINCCSAVVELGTLLADEYTPSTHRSGIRRTSQVFFEDEPAFVPQPQILHINSRGSLNRVVRRTSSGLSSSPSTPRVYVHPLH